MFLEMSVEVKKFFLEVHSCTVDSRGQIYHQGWIECVSFLLIIITASCLKVESKSFNDLPQNGNGTREEKYNEKKKENEKDVRRHIINNINDAMFFVWLKND